MSADPTGALRLALWGGARIHWAGYEPYRDVVLASRRALLAAARTLCLLPEIIPAPRRDDVALLHAFCRQVDDAVDEAASPAAAAAELARFRAEYLGEAPPRPLIAALHAGRARMRLPREAVLALLEGIGGDLGSVRIADDAELLRYCYRVSGSIGLLLCPLLDIPRRAWPRAVDLGIALQLSNILLGVAQDARKDRIYLPATRLAKAGLDAEAVLRPPGGARLGPVLAGVAELAARYYRSADEGVRDIPWRYRHGVLVMSRVYDARGRAAAAGTGAGLGAATIAGCLAAVLGVSLTPRMLGLTAPPPHEHDLHAPIAGWPGTVGAG